MLRLDQFPSSVWPKLRGNNRFISLDVGNTFLLLGTSKGSLYVFRREPSLVLEHIVPILTDPITKVCMRPDREDMFAICAEDKVCIVELELGNFKAKHKVLHTIEKHDAPITCLEWSVSRRRGAVLFSGDKDGFIVRSRLFDFTLSSRILLQSASAIVQLQANLDTLLVSNETHSLVIHCRGKDTQCFRIGTKARQGPYGVCFDPRAREVLLFGDDVPVQVQDDADEDPSALAGLPRSSSGPSPKIKTTQPQQNLVYKYTRFFCARPGRRLWTGSVAEGQVEATLKLTLPPAPSEFTPYEQLSKEERKKGSPLPQFSQLIPFKKNLLVVSADRKSICLVDPTQVIVNMWTQQLGRILDVAVCGNACLFLYTDDNKSTPTHAAAHTAVARLSAISPLTFLGERLVEVYGHLQMPSKDLSALRLQIFECITFLFQHRISHFSVLTVILDVLNQCFPQEMDELRSEHEMFRFKQQAQSKQKQPVSTAQQSSNSKEKKKEEDKEDEEDEQAKVPVVRNPFQMSIPQPTPSDLDESMTEPVEEEGAYKNATVPVTEPPQNKKDNSSGSVVNLRPAQKESLKRFFLFYLTAEERQREKERRRAKEPNKQQPFNAMVQAELASFFSFFDDNSEDQKRSQQNEEMQQQQIQPSYKPYESTNVRVIALAAPPAEDGIERSSSGSSFLDQLKLPFSLSNPFAKQEEEETENAENIPIAQRADQHVPATDVKTAQAVAVSAQVQSRPISKPEQLEPDDYSSSSDDDGDGQYPRERTVQETPAKSSSSSFFEALKNDLAVNVPQSVSEAPVVPVAEEPLSEKTSLDSVQANGDNSSAFLDPLGASLVNAKRTSVSSAATQQKPPTRWQPPREAVIADESDSNPESDKSGEDNESGEDDDDTLFGGYEHSSKLVKASERLSVAPRNPFEMKAQALAQHGHTMGLLQPSPFDSIPRPVQHDSSSDDDSDDDDDDDIFAAKGNFNVK